MPSVYKFSIMSRVYPKSFPNHKHRSIPTLNLLFCLKTLRHKVITTPGGNIMGKSKYNFVIHSLRMPSQ